MLGSYLEILWALVERASLHLLCPTKKLMGQNNKGRTKTISNYEEGKTGGEIDLTDTFNDEAVGFCFLWSLAISAPMEQEGQIIFLSSSQQFSLQLADVVASPSSKELV
jgi:hypothetical protein